VTVPRGGGPHRDRACGCGCVSVPDGGGGHCRTQRLVSHQASTPVRIEVDEHADLAPALNFVSCAAERATDASASRAAGQLDRDRASARAGRPCRADQVDRSLAARRYDRRRRGYANRRPRSGEHIFRLGVGPHRDRAPKRVGGCANRRGGASAEDCSGEACRERHRDTRHHAGDVHSAKVGRRATKGYAGAGEWTHARLTASPKAGNRPPRWRSRAALEPMAYG
jgi:hypothetical protein